MPKLRTPPGERSRGLHIERLVAKETEPKLGEHPNTFWKILKNPQLKLANLRRGNVHKSNKLWLFEEKIVEISGEPEECQWKRTEPNGLLFRLRGSLVRLTQVRDAVADCKESENCQVLLLGKGNGAAGEAKVEEQKRHEKQHHEVSEDHL